MAGRHERYADLRKYLEKQRAILEERAEPAKTITFAQIENCIGFRLPPSAYTHRAWWANGARKVWERAGFRTTDVDLTGRRVTFERKGQISPEELAIRNERAREAMRHLRQGIASKHINEGAVEAGSAPSSMPGMADGANPYIARDSVSKDAGRCRHPLYGALKGHIRLVGGTDITEPAEPEWGKRVWDGDTK